MDNLLSPPDDPSAEGGHRTEHDKVFLLPVQTRPSSTTPLPISAERVAKLLQDAGYKGNIVETETRTFVESSAEGWKFRVYFFDDRSQSTDYPASFMLSSGWSIDSKDADATFKAANIFNTQFRYLKAYVVVDEEYAYTEAEMSQFCPDGISNDGFNAFLDMFINLRQSYVSICRELRK